MRKIILICLQLLFSLFIVQAQAQNGCPNPIADITSAGQGFTRMFSDNTVTTTSIISWTWTFGDGGTSTLQNPTHTYASLGLYTVCMTVIDSCGTDMHCDTIDVTCPAPIASFTSVGGIQTVNFFDQSSSIYPSGTYAWTFGDGGTSNLMAPMHYYANTGDYYVCLTFTDSCGTDMFCDSVTVTCLPPSAGFSWSGSYPYVQFLDTSAGTGLSWNWDFGDGNSSTQQDPLHTYSGPGNYTVCLFISDSCGTDTVCENLIWLAKEMEMEQQVLVYPNPAKGFVFVELELSSEMDVSIQISDLSGRICAKPLSLKARQNRLRIPLEDLSKGLYFLSVEVDGKVHTTKLQVQ